MAAIDDLLEPSSEQIAFARRLRLSRSHRCPPLDAATES
jgi:hypothetical protein